MSAILQVTGLTKRYGSIAAVNDISLELMSDEIVAVIGPNAAGKSTLLRSISVLETVDAGDAALDGQRYLENGRIVCPSIERLRAQMVTVLQAANLFPNMTVMENLTFALPHVHQRPKDEAEAESEAMAQRLEIADVLLRYPNEISGGQAQKVSIGRAVLMRPKVLLLDEITAALSPTSIIAVIDALKWVKSEAANTHLSIIIVTHLMKFATEFAHRIHYMERGKIVESGEAASFLEKCQTREARAFVAANRIPF